MQSSWVWIIKVLRSRLKIPPGMALGVVHIESRRSSVFHALGKDGQVLQVETRNFWVWTFFYGWKIDSFYFEKQMPIPVLDIFRVHHMANHRYVPSSLCWLIAAGRHKQTKKAPFTAHPLQQHNQEASTHKFLSLRKSIYLQSTFTFLTPLKNTNCS